MKDDQEFLTELVKALVNEPKKVKVDRLVNERGVLLTIDCDPSDIGLLVGKQGHNIDAIRNLVRIIGMKNKSYVSVKINQPDRPENK